MKTFGMRTGLTNMFRIKPVYAHCDLPCGVYDPAQARIEAQSVQRFKKNMLSLARRIKFGRLLLKKSVLN